MKHDEAQKDTVETRRAAGAKRRDRIVAACILLTVMGVALYALVCLCRIAPPISVLFYMTPDRKAELIRSLVFPSLVCGILCILREAMDGNVRLHPASIAAVTAFALLPVGIVALFQITGQYGVSSQQGAAVGSCLICFLICTLTRELLPQSSLRGTHPVLRTVFCLLCGGIWGFCLFLAWSGRFLSLWGAASAFSLLSSLFGWICFFLWKGEPWVRTGIAVCISSLPVYLAVLQPYDTDGLLSAVICGILLTFGMLCAVVAGAVYGMRRRRTAKPHGEKSEQ